MSETKGSPGRAEKRRRRWWVLPLVLVALLVLIDLRAHSIPFLDYLGLILTWPVVVGILVVVLLFRHHDSVDYWIKNLRIRKGDEWSLGPGLQDVAGKAADEAAAVTTTKPGEEEEEPSPEDRRRYLFLVYSTRLSPATKALLAAVAAFTVPQSVSELVESGLFPAAEESTKSLKTARLLEVEGGWPSVTPLGYEFLDFLARPRV